MVKIVSNLIRRVYQVPFDHNWHELYWYSKYKLLNFIKYRTFDFFYKIELEIITCCNRRCQYCPNYFFPKQKQLMEINIFKKIISDLKKIDYSAIISLHFYGEPLLDTRLPELVKYIRGKLPKAYILIYTNGDYLNKNKFEQLLNGGVNKFFVTEHEDKPPKEFSLWYRTATVTEKRGIVSRRLNSDSILSNRAGLVKVKNKQPFEKCLMPKNNLIIDANGNLLLCCNDFFGKYSFGNIINKSLIDIWKDEVYRKARKKISQGKFSLDICKKCSFLNYGC